MPSTPMMRQYHEAKAAVGDALLLFRMGDFYELFFEDAKTAARELGLTLTSRDKGENPIPMAGFPHHQLNAYLAKIISAGHRAAICEQVEDPQQAKGLVRREVTRIVTPGTLTDDALLDPRTNNFLAALVRGETTVTKSRRPTKQPPQPLVGLAWIDLSTGRFLSSALAAGEIGDQLARLRPAECLIKEDDPAVRQMVFEETTMTPRPAWTFGYQQSSEALSRHFGTKSLEGFGFSSGTESDVLELRAAGAIFAYLHETQRASLVHIDRLQRWSREQTLQIDPATRRSLEITQTVRSGCREGSLLGVIDRTVTAIGARLLADWLAGPLTDRPGIEARLESVAEFVEHPAISKALRDSLRSIYDVERLLARIATGQATPRDLSHVGRTLAALPKLKASIADRRSRLLQQLEEQIDLCAPVRIRLGEALADECPPGTREGGIIRSGFHTELDELRELCAGGKQWMAAYQAEQIQRCGISSLKVGFNKVFGYYLEVTHAHRDKVPPDYQRKQTLKNAERYVTPELKEYEEKVLTADERAKQLEYELFMELWEMVAEVAHRLRATSAALAEIDVLAALAELARSRNYVKPEIREEPVLLIKEGRHPVLDITEPEGTFVPNDLEIYGTSGGTGGRCTLVADREGATTATAGSLLLITGPNMAGKSTYIRQAALITLLAQIGSFVPAQRAEVGIADRIFARVGASDELSRGQSTFMVEMMETARILNTSTEKSLVILDEIGRGTSTYDGLSLAWSIVEHLHDRIGCRTLFATHYHELTELEHQLDGVRNANVAVREWDDKVVFLHQVVPGAADKSYGIHVAQLAGVPREVNERARQVLAGLEFQHVRQTTADADHHDPASEWISSQGPANGNGQLTLFDTREHPLIDEIKAVNLDQMTPLEALQVLDRWQRDLISTDRQRSRGH